MYGGRLVAIVTLGFDRKCFGCHVTALVWQAVSIVSFKF